MSARITAAEAATILRDLARGREDGNGGDVWPLYDRAEDAMAAVIGLAAETDAHRTRADAAEADRDALRAECERLRAEAADIAEAVGVPYMGAHGLAGVVRLRIGALMEQGDVLRAIVAGRTTAPTDDQIREHLRDKPDSSTGLHRGSWLITSEYGGLPLVRRNAETCIRIAAEQRLRCIGWCWIALDRNGRPCAWPVKP